MTRPVPARSFFLPQLRLLELRRDSRVSVAPRQLARPISKKTVSRKNYKTSVRPHAKPTWRNSMELPELWIVLVVIAR